MAAKSKKRTKGGNSGSGAGATIELAEFLPYRFDVFNSDLGRLLARVYAQQFDIGEHEWRVLAVLGREQPLAANEVGERAAMDKVQVSRAVAKLATEGLVLRHQDKADRRRSSLRLSARGSRALGKLAPMARARESALAEALSDRERVQFERSLRKLHARAVELLAEN